MEEQPAVRCARAVVDWGGNLRKSRRLDPEAQDHIAVAEALDGIYGRVFPGQ